MFVRGPGILRTVQPYSHQAHWQYVLVSFACGRFCILGAFILRSLEVGLQRVREREIWVRSLLEKAMACEALHAFTAPSYAARMRRT